MTDGPPGARASAWRGVGLLAPGLPHLVGGRWRAGGLALTVWVGLWAVVVLRPGAVAGAVLGDASERFALGTLLAALAAVWLWAWRSADALGSGKSDPVGSWKRTYALNGLAVAGAGALVLLYLAAALAPFLSPFDPLAPGDLGAERWAAPSLRHPLGTDGLARDVLSRVLYGARVSLGVGLLAVTISASLGTAVGAAAGYFGGWVDSVLMRAVDLVLAFPRLVLLIALVAVFEPSVLLIVVALGLTLWPDTARLVRAEVLAVRETDFVTAARAMGSSRFRVLSRHVVPNALAPVVVAATLGVGNVIILEAGLSFLGVGVEAPLPSWGGMVAAGRAELASHWWLSTFSGAAIVVTVLSFNLVGEGLRDALDPRSRAR